MSGFSYLTYKFTALILKALKKVIKSLLFVRLSYKIECFNLYILYMISNGRSKVLEKCGG